MLYGRQNVLFSIILLNYQKGVKYLFPLTLPIFFPDEPEGKEAYQVTSGGEEPLFWVGRALLFRKTSKHLPQNK